MPTDALALTLLRLASPALPVGGFSYSEGLEAAVDQGLVGDRAGVTDWLLNQLHLVQARSEAAVVALAARAWHGADFSQLHALNEWLLQTRETSELRLQTEQMGASLLKLFADVAQRLDARVVAYPLAFACTAANAGASAQQACRTYLFAWAENMVAAAIKAVPLGQTDGQGVLLALMADIPAATERACSTEFDQLQSCAPMLAIVSAQHEVQYSRLFRS
jgi:urease accessory protein